MRGDLLSWLEDNGHPLSAAKRRAGGTRVSQSAPPIAAPTTEATMATQAAAPPGDATLATTELGPSLDGEAHGSGVRAWIIATAAAVGLATIIAVGALREGKANQLAASLVAHTEAPMRALAKLKPPKSKAPARTPEPEPAPKASASSSSAPIASSSVPTKPRPAPAKGGRLIRRELE
jgi:hypothetical protein